MPPDTQRRKSDFRETARELVGEDRHNRKFGQNQDFAAAIARALEAAYKRGVSEAGAVPGAEPAQQELRRKDVPPRPRNALWIMYLWTFGGPSARLAPSGRTVLLKPQEGVRGLRSGQGWQMMIDSVPQADATFGRTTIDPFVRLGLLSPALVDPELLTLTTDALDLYRRAMAQAQAAGREALDPG